MSDKVAKDVIGKFMVLMLNGERLSDAYGAIGNVICF